MTQEEKQLLLKDICARLPYFENWVQYEGKDYIVTGYGHGRVSLLPSAFSSAVGPCPLVEEVKPYLRPMSSMTEEEIFEFSKIEGIDVIAGTEKVTSATLSVDAIDWFNEHHFDYRGLIRKELALEAPKDMYEKF